MDLGVGAFSFLSFFFFFGSVMLGYDENVSYMFIV